jgi:hypothetical protein
MGTARKIKKEAKNLSVDSTMKGIGKISDEVGGVLESAMGTKGKRHKAAKASAARKAVEKKLTEASEEAGRIREGAVKQKMALEQRSRDIDPMQSERIARGDVRDVVAAPIGSATIAQAPQEQFRQTQQTLGAQLAERAAGRGLSPAQLQLQQATEQNIAQQAAMRAGASGAGAALARREIGRTGAQLSQQAAQQGALLRAQEQQAAQAQLGQLAAQARGQDIGLATSQAQMEQQAILQSADQNLRAQLANQGVDLDVLKDNARRGDAASLANMQSQLQQLGMNDAMIKAYMGQELGATGLQANIATGQQSALAQQQAAQAAASSQQQAGMMSGIATLGAAALPILAASDVNLKKDIKDGKKSIGEFLNNLKSHDYKYKDEKYGKGPQTSVMAQDLEKSEIGKKAVIETPEGKLVDYTKLLPAMLAGLSDSHREIMDLKEALKKKKERK